MANKGESNIQDNHHLALPKYDPQNHNTIYKLRLSMKKKLFNPQHLGAMGGIETPSPEGAKEVRDMLKRLVEIDNESREILSKVFSVLDKDEKLESYIKKRIDDPKVSRMWQLVEQVLACQEEDTNFDELLMIDDNDSSNNNNFRVYEDKSIKGWDEIEDEKRVERFKVKNIASGTGQGVGSSTSQAPK